MTGSSGDAGENRLDLLIERYLAEELTEAEEKDLADRVRANPRALDRIAEQFRLDEGLRTLHSSEGSPDALARAVVERLQNEKRAPRFASEVVERIRKESPRAERKPPTARRKAAGRRARGKRTMLPMLAAAAAVILTFVAVVLMTGNSGPGSGRGELVKGPPEALPRAVPVPEVRAPAQARIPSGARRPVPGENPLRERPPLERAPRKSEARPLEKKDSPPREPSPQKPTRVPTSKSVVAVMTVERVEGNVLVRAGVKKSVAAAGLAVLSGQDLETVGPKSRAVLRCPDGTRLEIEPGTVLRVVGGAEGGKRLAVDRGALLADVSPQAKDRPMEVTTPHAKATVLGTALRIVVNMDGGKGSTRLEVTQGKVRLTRLLDGKSVDVVSGHYAVAAAGVGLAPKAMSRTITMGGGATKPQDTYLYGYAGYENANYGGRASLMVERNGAVSLLWFPGLLGSKAGHVPAKSTVHSASLKLKCLSNGPHTPISLALHRSLKPWNEGKGDGNAARSGGATWKAAQQSRVRWETPGAQGRTDRSPDPGATAAKVDASGFVTFDITGVVQAWADGQPNLGLILAPGTGSLSLTFASSEDPKPENRPQLTVTFSK